MGNHWTMLEERAAAARAEFREVAAEVRRTRDQMAALRWAMHRQRGLLFPLLLDQHEKWIEPTIVTFGERKQRV